MIPTLYKADTQDFSTNGVASLVDALTVRVTEGLNGVYELYMEYPANGLWTAEIQDFRIIRAKPNDEDDLHNFTIYDIVQDYEADRIFVYATTSTNKLGNNLVTSVTHGGTPQTIFNIMKNRLVEPTDMNFVSDITTVSSVEWIRRNPLNCIVGEEGSLVQIFGGEVKRTDDTIYLYSRRGRDKVMTVRQGRHVAGYRRSVSTNGIVTRILPYFTHFPEGSEDEVTVEGAIVNSPLINNYPIRSIIPIDYSNDPDVTDLASLNNKAKTYFSVQNPDADKPKVNIEVNLTQVSESSEYSKFKKLEQVRLADTIDVWVPKFNVDVTVKVTEIEYDSLLERTVRLKAGSPSGSFYDNVKNTYKQDISQIRKYVDGVENGLRNVIQASSDGKNKIFRGYTEPPIGLAKVNDLWFKPNGSGEWTVHIFDGLDWQPIVYESMGAETRAAVEEALSAAEEARLQAKLNADQALVDAKAHADAEVVRIDTRLSAEISGAIGLAEQAKADAVSKANQALVDAKAHAEAEDTRIKQEIGLEVAGAIGIAEQARQDAIDEAEKALADAKAHTEAEVQASKEAFDAQFAIISDEVTDAQRSADTANQQINEAVTNAGFSTLADLTADLQSISNRADANALAAIDNASAAMSNALTALDNISGLESTVQNINVDIDDINGTLDLKADRQTVDTLSGIVENHTLDIQANAEGLALKADSSVVDTLSGDVSTLSTQVGLINGELSSKISQTQMQSAIDGIEIGGRNLLRNTNPEWVELTLDSGQTLTYVHPEVELKQDSTYTFTVEYETNDALIDVQVGTGLIGYERDIVGWNATNIPSNQRLSLTHKVLESELIKGTSRDSFSIDDDFYLDSAMIVTSQSNPLYSANGMINPPIGGVFNNIQRDGVIPANRRRIDFPPLHNTIVVLLDYYSMTKDMRYLNKAKLIADYILTIEFQANFAGQKITLVAGTNMWDGTTWALGKSEIGLRIVYNGINVMTLMYEHTNDERYATLAKKLMITATTANGNIKNRISWGDLGSYMTGALYDQIYVNPDSNNASFSWMKFNQNNADTLVEAYHNYIRVFGDTEVTTAENLKIKPSVVVDEFAKWILAINARGELTMTPTGLPYILYDYPAGGVNWDWVSGNNTRGDVWFTGDAVLWFIKGLSLISNDYPQIKQLADTYFNNLYSLKAASHPELGSLVNQVLFHDRYNFDGTILEDDMALSISSTALFWDIGHYLNLITPKLEHDLINTLKVNYPERTGNKDVDGAYSWDSVDSQNSWIELKANGEIYHTLLTFYFAKSEGRNIFGYKITNKGPKSTIRYRRQQLEHGNISTDWTPAPEDTVQLISNVETEWRQTAQGFAQDITRVETGLDGKASLAAFNTLTSKVDGSIQRIGDAEGNITQIEANVSGLQTTVASKADSSTVTQLATLVDTKVSNDEYQTQISTMANNINARVSKGDVMSQINIEAGRTLIQSNRLVLDANSVVFTGTAFIPSAQIQSLHADKITAGTIDSARINATEIVTAGLTTNVIKSTHIETSTATIDKLFATDAMVNRLTAKTAFITSIQTIDISAARITSGTIDSARINAAQVVTQGLTANIIKSTHIETSTATVDKIFATDAMINQLTTKTAFITSIKAVDIDASKITSGTIAAARINASAVVTAGLTANVIKSTHLETSTATISKLFATDATVNQLTATAAFIASIKAIEISADKITTGTLNAANLNVINLQTSHVVGLNAEFIRTHWNSIGNQISISAENGIQSIGANGDTVRFKNGEIEFRRATQGRHLLYNPEGLILTPFATNTGTSLNTSLILNGISIGAHQYIDFNEQQSSSNNRRARIEHVFDDLRLRHPDDGKLRVHDRSMSTNGGTIEAMLYETRHVDGNILQIIGNRVQTPRSGNRDIYLSPQGTGVVQVANTSLNYYNIRASGFLNSSSRRLKTDIFDYKESALQHLNGLNIVEYRLKKDIADGVDLVHVGLIAEDSGYVSDGQSIDTYKLLSLNTKAIQELDEKYENSLKVASHAYLLSEQHEEELDVYKQKLKELEDKIKKLEGAA